MKRKITALSMILIMMIGLCPQICAGTAAAVEIYVSPDGSDSATGEKDAPLRTIEGAKAMVQKKRASAAGEIAVIFASGEYQIDHTVNFTSDDSGTTAAPVVYRAAEGAEVTFSGSRSLNPAAFLPVTDKKIRERIQPEVVDKIGVIDLKSQGIDSLVPYVLPAYFFYTATDLPMLYVNDKRQTIARWPNVGYANVDKVINPGQRYEAGARHETASVPAVIEYTNERADRWKTAPDALLEGFFKYDYAYDRMKIGSVDPKANTITTKESVSTFGVVDGARYIVNNLLEELDMPGEFYIDREEMKLYFYPPYTLTDTSLELSVMSDVMFWLNGVSNVRFEGLRFERTMDTVMEMDNCTDVQIRGCTFKNIGKECISLTNGKRVAVTDSNFISFGSTGVYLRGGDQQTLTPGENSVTNCEFYDFGLNQKTYGAAVYMTGVGNSVEHCVMHEAPHYAISYSGNDHKIRYNEIYNVVKESLDAGAIYAGRSFVDRGTEIAYNYLHDIQYVEDGSAAALTVGIYMDDMLCGNHIHHNIIENTALGMLLGGGRDHIVHDNLIINGRESITFDSRGEGWGKSMAVEGGECYQSLQKVPYQSQTYSKYPNLSTILSDEQWVPKYNLLYDNLVVNTKPFYLQDSVIKYAERLENNINIEGTKDFENAAEHQFAFRADSELKQKLPNMEFNMDDFGIYTNEYRTEITPPQLQFKKSFPKTGEEEQQNLSNLFRWEAAEGADYYILRIAIDPEMKQIVYEKKTPYAYLEVKNLQANEMVYYWDVTAYAMGRQLKTQQYNRGKPYRFTTTQYDAQVTSSALEQTAVQAEQIIAQMQEGEEIGQYLPGSKQMLQDALTGARDVLSEEHPRQSEIDSVSANLSNVMNQVQKRQNRGFVNFSEFVGDKKSWGGNGGVSIEGNTVRCESDVIANTVRPMQNCEGISAMLEVETKGSWVAIALRQNDTSNYVYNTAGNCYLMVIKEDVIEFQKFTLGYSEFLDTLENKYIKNGEPCRLDFSAIDVESGVRILVRVNNETVFDYVDMNHPFYEAGNMALYNPSGGGYIQLSGVEETADDSLLGKAGVSEIKKAENLFAAGDWQQPAEEQAGLLRFSGEQNATKEKLPLNFETAFSIKAAPGEGDAWQALGFHMADGTCSPWETEGYLLVMRKDRLELVRCRGGKKEFLAIVPNALLGNGQWHDVKITSNQQVNGTLLTVFVDGKECIAYEDPYALSQAGYFAVYDHSGSGLELAAERGVS